MWRLVFFIVPFLCFSSTTTSYVYLINDSPFPLTAVVQSQTGKYLGQITLQPGEQRNQVSNLQSTPLDSQTYETALSPYTVIWKCSNEGYYSICNSVSPGALIQASNCPGVYYCKPKPKKNPRGKGKCCE